MTNKTPELRDKSYWRLCIKTSPEAEWKYLGWNVFQREAALEWLQQKKQQRSTYLLWTSTTLFRAERCL